MEWGVGKRRKGKEEKGGEAKGKKVEVLMKKKNSESTFRYLCEKEKVSVISLEGDRSHEAKDWQIVMCIRGEEWCILYWRERARTNLPTLSSLFPSFVSFSSFLSSS